MKKGMDWSGFGLKKAVCLVAGLAAFGLADNPISSYHYLADPSCTADDEYFYIITDSDDPAGNSGYTIKQLYAFRSRDMKNWTDFGVVLEAQREYDNINDIWASGVAINPNDHRFYIVYPNGGGGVGLVGADNINGPYTNPIPENKKLVQNYGGALVDCDGIANCFDPAIFYDDDKDHTGYFTFGGGNNTSTGRPHGYNFDLYKFNSDMKGIVTSSKVQLEILRPNGQRIQNSFEASYLHKNNGVYYLSYSTDFSNTIDEYTGNTCGGCIGYATSKKIEGPYTYQGIFLENPKVNGVNINAYNNNHHGVAKFKDHWYVVYHDRRLVQASEHPSCPKCSDPSKPEQANHRSVSIDEITYNGEKINNATLTNEGPKQLDNFNPYETYPALTSSKQRNVRSRTDWNESDWKNGIAAKHVLTPLSSKESWIRVSGVDFGTEGAKSFNVVAASMATDNKIEIHKGTVSGETAGTCNLQKTNGWNDYAENSCDVTGLTGEVDQLFIVFKGKQDSTMGILEWSFTCNGDNCKASEPQKQTPFGGVAAEIPGKIEAENFDVPGTGYANKSYSDSDSEDHGAESNGGTSYREGTGVDIYKKATGYIVGYNAEGEWLEYTVDVKEAGNYTVFASVATDNETSGFSLTLDGEPLATFATKGTSFDVFDTVQANVTIPTAGIHILRMTVTGAWFDVDFFAFAKGEDAKIEDVPAALPKMARFNAGSTVTYSVFDLRGSKVASFTVQNGNNVDLKATVTNLVKRSGFYLLKPNYGGAVKRITVTK